MGPRSGHGKSISIENSTRIDVAADQPNLAPQHVVVEKHYAACIEWHKIYITYLLTYLFWHIKRIDSINHWLESMEL